MPEYFFIPNIIVITHSIRATSKIISFGLLVLYVRCECVTLNVIAMWALISAHFSIHKTPSANTEIWPTTIAYTLWFNHFLCCPSFFLTIFIFLSFSKIEKVMHRNGSKAFTGNGTVCMQSHNKMMEVAATVLQKKSRSFSVVLQTVVSLVFAMNTLKS